MKKKTVLLICVGRKGDTSYNMFSSLSDFLSERYACRMVLFGASSSLTLLWTSLRHLKDVVWANTVVVHVASAPTIVMLSAAKILFRKVIIFQWDIYPTTIAGVRQKNRLVHRILYKLEHVCYALADRIVIPSVDFVAYSAARKSVIMPLWPQLKATRSPVPRQPIADGPVHIAFAGQINEMRGLAECIVHLATCSPNRIVLHLFSANRLPPDFDRSMPSIQIEEHGAFTRDELEVRLTEMHFGLVSLHPRMDQPGFPSKTFDYLASGLPILYFGRPLPGYTSDIEKFGVGIDITKRDKLDLHIVYESMSLHYDSGRLEYLAHTSLKWSEFAKIC